MEAAEDPPLPAARAQRIEAIQTVFRTPPPGQLDAAQVRRACTSANTKKAYQSYMNGVTKWVKATQDSADRFFNQDGSLNLTTFTPEHFENFLMYMMNGGKHKVSTLSGYRSALKDAYRQQRMEVPREYMGELKTLFQGLQRVEAESIQDGHERKPGKEPLTFSLYVQLAELSVKQNDNGFIHLFLLTQWNLMCRSRSVETLHTSHLHYSDDSVGFVLHKTKTNQEGSGPKDPRHVYANPLQPACCWMLAFGLFLASNPALLPGKLFPGSNQKARFSKTLGNMLEELTGQKIYGTHSIRKGVATFASSGSTGGPSVVSVCLRCGWSMGGVQDRYFRYEAAGDQYLGRVVAGLPQNSSQFAVLPPHFVDPNSTLVTESLARMFPSMYQDAHIAPVLKLCLASVIKHYDYLVEKLSSKHPMRSSYVFCNPSVLSDLRKLLVVGRTSWMRPTGIPPQVELFQQHAETRKSLQQLPSLLLDGFSKLLDEKCIGGQSLTRDTLATTIKSMLQEAGLWKLQDSTAQQRPQPDPLNTIYHWRSDGHFHRLPEDFDFPQLDALGVWRMWWLGNPACGYPPFRALQPTDFTKRNRKMYSEWAVLVRHITTAIEAKLGTPMQKLRSHEDVDRLFKLGLANIALKQSTSSAKQRPERAVTTLVFDFAALFSDPQNDENVARRVLMCIDVLY